MGQDEWTSRHGLPRLVKQALLYEAQQILDRRNRDRNEQEQKIKLAEYQKRQAIEYKEKTILEAQAEAEKQRLMKSNVNVFCSSISVTCVRQDSFSRTYRYK